MTVLLRHTIEPRRKPRRSAIRTCLAAALCVIAQRQVTFGLTQIARSGVCAKSARVCAKVDQQTCASWTPGMHNVPKTGASLAWRTTNGVKRDRQDTLLFALCAFAFALPANAQAKYQPPRTPDGKPDLQGMWTNSSITTLERNNASLPFCSMPSRWRGWKTRAHSRLRPTPPHSDSDCAAGRARPRRLQRLLA